MKERQKVLDIFKDFLHAKRLRVLDIFYCWNKDKDFNITRKEFEQGIRNTSLPLTKYQVTLLMQCVEGNDCGLVDYREFAKLFVD